MSRSQYHTKDLEDALENQDIVRVRTVFVELSGLSVLDVALDDEDNVLYAAVKHDDGAVRAVCAYVNVDQELVIVPEQDGPLFLGCPAPLIEMLDGTFGESAVRWRRDCLARYYRTMSRTAYVGHPAWTAYYSEQSLGIVHNAAHIAVIVGGAPAGMQSLAITDGVHWREISVPVAQLASLEPLWPLEWNSHGYTVLAMRGRGALRYLGVGPSEYRVGMLFNDQGGLLAWSGAASHCVMMASMTDSSETGFSRAMLLAQLNQWQGRQIMV